MPCQQVTRSAKPGEKRGERKHVERRNLAAVVNCAMAVRGTMRRGGMPHVRMPRPMKMRMREMQAQAAGDKDHHTQKEPDHKTDQIEIRPGHSRAPFLPLLVVPK